VHPLATARSAARASILLAGLLAVPLLAGGCGYALVGQASNVPDDVRRVYVAPLENRTPRSQADQFVTRAIADEMVTRQRFTVVSSESEADAVLSGAVNSFGVTPVAFDDQGRATEYEISITTAVEFKRLGGEEDEVIWKNDRYLFRENYPVEVTGTDYLDRENQAIEDAAEKFAETMVSDLLQGF
jgi:outer membrane lipopolysaccharide assembly protein LptE/RlpB